MQKKESSLNHLKKRFSEEDPWNYGKSLYEKRRFEGMLALIKEVPHKSILEVGCAEGHFTKLLTTVSKDVVAIDIIPTALERAKLKAPKAHFILKSIEDFAPAKTFDLVIFADVIYYIGDKNKALKVTQKSGRYLITGNNILMGVRLNTGDRHFWRFPLLKIKAIYEEGKLCLVTLRKLQ